MKRHKFLCHFLKMQEQDIVRQLTRTNTSSRTMLRGTTTKTGPITLIALITLIMVGRKAQTGVRITVTRGDKTSTTGGWTKSRHTTDRGTTTSMTSTTSTTSTRRKTDFGTRTTKLSLSSGESFRGTTKQT